MRLKLIVAILSTLIAAAAYGTWYLRAQALLFQPPGSIVDPGSIQWLMAVGVLFQCAAIVALWFAAVELVERFLRRWSKRREERRGPVGRG